MNHLDVKDLLAAGLALAAIVATALWSWNTLADLFGAPEVQFRHALATLALFAILRLAIRRRRSAIRCQHRP